MGSLAEAPAAVVLLVLFLAAQKPFFKKPTLQTATVGRQDLGIVVEVSGKIKAERSANLSFAALGQLEKIASSGAVFERGEIIARLQTKELYAALQQAYASLWKW